MKQSTIIISGKPFTYQDEVGDPYLFNKCTPDDAHSILTLTDNLLSKCGINYFIAFGTLLGAVREGDFINGDEDVDIVTSDEQKLYESLPYLAQNGLFVNRIFREELYSFHLDGRRGHIDIYVLKKITKPSILSKHYVKICGHLQPRRYFCNIINDGKYTLRGHAYPYPNDPEKILVQWYGRSWRIPQDKQAVEDILFIRILHLFRKILRKITKH